mmetsp:Transcript_70078/g.194809  ORF Transcript_70078/g.194809 Transcript_70078/m.194809 type:complete len:540 (-) Transcript_70078:139-1758(-)
MAKGRGASAAAAVPNGGSSGGSPGAKSNATPKSASAKGASSQPSSSVAPGVPRTRCGCCFGFACGMALGVVWLAAVCLVGAAYLVEDGQRFLQYATSLRPLLGMPSVSTPADATAHRTAALEAELKKLRVKRQEAEASRKELRESADAAAALEKEVKLLRTQLQDSASTASARDAELERLRKQLKEGAGASSALDAEVQRLQKQLQETVGVSSSREAEVERLREQLEEHARTSSAREAELERMRKQLQENAGALSAREAELDLLRGRLRDQEAELERERARTNEQEQVKVGENPAGAGLSWPQCMYRGFAFTGPSARPFEQDMVAHFGDAAVGCHADNCRSSDKVMTKRPEDCARLCAVSDGCEFWTHGAEGNGESCWLRASDGGRQATAGFVSGARRCAPAESEVHPARAALAIVDSAALKACDSGIVGAVCPNLHDAARTWKHGIGVLLEAIGAKGMQSMKDHITQITSDVEACLSVDETDERLPEVFATAAHNNRMVFDALRSFLVSNVPSQDAPSRLDVSVPRPVRGLLCRGKAC